MREFFHGWRRKVGCVLLVMALPISAAWGRSYLIRDLIFISHETRLDTIVSFRGSLRWGRCRPSSAEEFYPTAPPDWESRVISSDGTYEFSAYDIDESRLEWTWKFLGAGLREFSDPESYGARVLVVPYAPIAIPLSLLSAYLILWKPRKRD